MANTFLTPSMIAREALATLYAQTEMAALVWRDFDADFNGAVGDTITVRKPATFAAEEFDRSSGITVQNATETGVTVTLDTLLDVSFAVTAEDLTLEIGEFGEQLLVPAMEAISQAIDVKLLGLRADVTASVTDATPDGDTVIDLRKVLNDAKVPASQRYGVYDTATSAALLKDPLFHEADKRGDTQGLMEAAIGRKFGIDHYETQNIDDGQGVVFHRSAFALVSRTLALPRGVDPSRAAIVGYKGFGLRVVYDYDITEKQDVVSIDTLIGVKTMDANRAVLLNGPDWESA